MKVVDKNNEVLDDTIVSINQLNDGTYRWSITINFFDNDEIPTHYQDIFTTYDKAFKALQEYIDEWFIDAKLVE